MIGLINLELGRDCLLLNPVDMRGNSGAMPEPLGRFLSS